MSKTAIPTPPTLILAMFGDATLKLVLEVLASDFRPAGTRVLLGSYGVSPATAKAVEAVAEVDYAPIFGIQPDASKAARAGRRLPKAQLDLLSGHFDGPIPADLNIPMLPVSRERNWGVELGRRFRDALREAERKGVIVPEWQFDEILGECRTAGPNRYRRFIGGVLRGLALGRPELQDLPRPGIVWTAWTAMQRLPTMRITTELQTFWEDVDIGTKLLVGEEYPAFKGDPSKTARQYAVPHESLATNAGSLRRGLGARYVTGMTPGWKTGGGLGGNVGGRTDEWVSTWRKGFIEGRIGQHKPTGYAHFYLAKENALPERVADTVRSLLHAAAIHMR